MLDDLMAPRADAEPDRAAEPAGPGRPPAGPARIHRPERSWPHPPRPVPIDLAAPPAEPDPGNGRWAAALPALGSLSMVAFAFMVHSLVYLIVLGLMVVVMVGAGLATTWLQRRNAGRRWQRSRQRYLDHLDRVRAEAAAAASAQRDAAQACFPDPDALCRVAASGDGLWERRPADPDFTAVRLGRGPVPAARPVRMSGDGGPLAEADPELSEAADRLIARTAVLPGAPVVISLRGLGCVAVVGGGDAARELVGAWLAGLATFHAPGELRIMGLVPLSAVRTWDWLKWLPHTRDPDAGEGLGRVRRAVTSDVPAFTAAVESLARQRLDRLRRRAEDPAGAVPAATAGETEHVVVVVDGYRPGAGPGALDALLGAAAAVSVTVVVMVRDASEVPAICGARIDWPDPATVRYVESGPAGRVEARVMPDRLGAAEATRLARTLAPIALRSGEAGADLADPVRLVELLGADDAAQLDMGAGWLGLTALADGPPEALLRLPIGRAGDGSVAVLDLKEAAAGGMGPHGMLVGATGSGKSELLRSVTAAVAARHDPSLVNMLLIDFKGGAAFAELAGLPQVAGLVTNLADDPTLIERVRQALSGELARRQEALRLAGNLASITDYQVARARGAPLDPLGYLLVVVDEFGELLAARPDFLDTFITIGRLGRSLGVHLLMATQRLDEGRIRGLEPHLRYRICLRTFTAAESRAVLGSPDAYELPPIPGLGYLSVDGEMTRFKAALCGTMPTLAKDAGGPAGGSASGLLQPLSLSSTVPWQRPRASGPRVNDLAVLVDLARRAAPGPARQIWVAPLPGVLTLGGLAARFGSGPEQSRVGVAVGLTDLPERQDQQPLCYQPDGPGGNLGLAGASRSGKSTLLQTLVLALAAGAGAGLRQFYCLDLGGGGLFELAGLPQVGAVIGRGEAEAAARLLRDLRALLDERAAGRRAGVVERGWPRVFLVVDNVGQLRQSAPDLEAELAEIATAGLPYGLHVIVSANRWLDVRPQLLDALGTRWELHLADPAESLIGRAAAARVSPGQPGRGLTRDGYLFQAALPMLSGEPTPAGLAEAVAAVASAAGGVRAPAIAPLPARVTAGQAAALALAAGSVPSETHGEFLLGISEFRARPVHLPLARPGTCLLIFGDGGSGRTTLLRRAVRHLEHAAGPGSVVLHIVDPRRGLIDLAEGPGVASYAVSAGAAEKLAVSLAAQLQARMPPDDATLADLRRDRRWPGPCQVLVVDDYDLLLGAMGGPFGPLADQLAHGAEIGLAVLAARRVAGSQRTAFEPFGQRLREVAGQVLVLSGSADEGPLAGGVTARAWPPGRGMLVSGRARPHLVQCLDEDDRAPGQGSS
ncbi:MAG: type VII secretion protein EccCa [Streptosporangiaceae bacterium]